MQRHVVLHGAERRAPTPLLIFLGGGHHCRTRDTNDDKLRPLRDALFRASSTHAEPDTAYLLPGQADR
ncbi:hypothetical protein VTN02DRAFT_54 [Thermoascus thermophilus]